MDGARGLYILSGHNSLWQLFMSSAPKAWWTVSLVFLWRCHNVGTVVYIVSLWWSAWLLAPLWKLREELKVQLSNHHFGDPAPVLRSYKGTVSPLTHRGSTHHWRFWDFKSCVWQEPRGSDPLCVSHYTIMSQASWGSENLSHIFLEFYFCCHLPLLGLCYHFHTILSPLNSFGLNYLVIQFRKYLIFSVFFLGEKAICPLPSVHSIKSPNNTTWTLSSAL